jgi:hypothetical protein
MTGPNKPLSPYERTMRRIAAFVLAAGLVSAVAIFVAAPVEPSEEGGAYVASVDNSKKYQLELERIGGRAAVVATQFNDWFAGLWHGRSLAGTIAVLSVAVAALIRLAGKLPPLDD